MVAGSRERGDSIDAGATVASAAAISARVGDNNRRISVGSGTSWNATKASSRNEAASETRAASDSDAVVRERENGQMRAPRPRSASETLQSACSIPPWAAIT